jgi:hypothetical protein
MLDFGITAGKGVKGTSAVDLKLLNHITTQSEIK